MGLWWFRERAVAGWPVLRCQASLLTLSVGWRQRMSVVLNFAFECSERPFTQGFGVDVLESVIQSEESG